MIKKLTATTADIEAVAKLEEEDYERDLPEEEDPYGRMHEYLQSQLSTVIDNSSSAEAVSNLGNVVTTVSSGINAHTNVTFLSMPPATLNSQQPSSKFPHPVPPPFTMKPTKSPPKSTSDEDIITKLAEVFTQRQDRDSLPRPEPVVFKGDLLRYPMWIKSFEKFTVRKTKDPSERLYYISKSITDGAKEAVSGLLP